MKWKKHVDRIFAGKDGYPVVEVEWHDAQARAIEWEEKIDHSVMPTVSVGYLVDDSQDSITLVSIVNHIHVCHAIVIPRGCIHKVTHLVRYSKNHPVE